VGLRKNHTVGTKLIKSRALWSSDHHLFGSGWTSEFRSQWQEAFLIARTILIIEISIPARNANYSVQTTGGLGLVINHHKDPLMTNLV
jgi:hypothetical protein